VPRNRKSEAATPARKHTIAVALHDIEPATFERCAGVREWLGERGVDRVTLLVIPARDLHPLGERSPELVDWLRECRRAGDSIAQHGFQHQRLRRASWSHRLLSPVRTRRAAEFVGLDGTETRRAVESGWRLLKLAGIEPDGFVAPAYAYTPALRGMLSARFRWWASLLGLHGALALETSPDDARSWRRLAPAWSLDTDGALDRAFAPALIRAGGLLARDTLRLDLHPSDLQSPRQVRALERVLTGPARPRTAITYDALASAGPATAEPMPKGAPQARRIGAERSKPLAL
jgi:predicted deacetylase